MLESINVIGQKNKFKYYITFGKYEGQFQIYEELVNCFKNNHQLTGILNILSYMYPDQKVISLLSTIGSELIAPENFTEHKYKEAAVIVNLARKDLSNKELNQTLDYGIDYSEQYPRVIPQIIIMIERKLFAPSVSEKLLSSIYNKLSKSQWEYMSHIDKLIVEQLTMRISDLSKKSDWGRLGLPLGGSLLLPE